MKKLLVLTALFFFSCAQDNSGPSPAPTLHGLPFGTKESVCDNVKTNSEVFSINFSNSSNYYSKVEYDAEGCYLVSQGTYAYDGTTLTLTEISVQKSPISCGYTTPRPPINLTGTTSLRANRLVWNYVNQNNQNCTVYFDR